MLDQRDQIKSVYVFLIFQMDLLYRIGIPFFLPYRDEAICDVLNIFRLDIF